MTLGKLIALLLSPIVLLLGAAVTVYLIFFRKKSPAKPGAPPPHAKAPPAKAPTPQISAQEIAAGKETAKYLDDGAKALSTAFVSLFGGDDSDDGDSAGVDDDS